MKQLNPTFPLSDVILRKVKTPRKVELPLFGNDSWQINQNEFAMQVEGVGSFYAFNGKEVEYAPVLGADEEWISIYLNGQVLAALMHQRKIINFHASSFIYKEKGVMVLGETGAGKSSIVAAFILGGAGFLSDDFTPVIFYNGEPCIWPVYKKIKLRKNTVQQLRIKEERLKNVEKVTGKFFLNVEKATMDHYPLDIILKIEIGEKQSSEFYLPEPAEKFSLLRSEVCSWEMLAGMPDTEAAYLQQLLDIVSRIKMVKIVRPADIPVPELHRIVEEYMGNVEKLRKA